jgi:hypothetical protein
MAIAMKKIFKISKLLMILFLLIPSPSYAVTLKDALDQAAKYFVKQAVRIEPGEELHVLEVVNFASREHDLEGKKIETEMYFALERQLPDFKLFLGKGQNPKREIYLAGTYELKAGITNIKLRVFKGSEILAQTEVSFDTKTHRKTLVAVLDLEAVTMNAEQRKVFSDVFRSALIEIDAFDIASSADIDKMNPDEIQEATGCTRDTCATIIGEQLGVDRVISSSLRKVDEDYYFLTAKMMDIADGSILASKTVEHSGSLRTLKDALQTLAEQIAGDPAKFELAEDVKPIIAVKPQPAEMVDLAAEDSVPVEENLPAESIEEDSGWPWWYWVVGVGAVAAIAAALGGGGDDGGSSGSGSSSEECPAGAGNCGSVSVKW